MENRNETVEFVNKIQQMTREADKVEVTEINGEKYVTKALTRIKDFEPHCINVETLSGLTEVIKRERDKGLYESDLFVLVESPTKVCVQTMLLRDMGRNIMYTAYTKPSNFNFGITYDIESFLISLRSKFVSNEDVNYLASAVMNITNAKSIALKDDGVTQKAEARKGISLAGNVEIKPIVKVAPFRTFIEVAQPESEFLFRVTDLEDNVGASLHEADGGAWKIDAMNSIKEYLTKELKGVDGVYVIA